MLSVDELYHPASAGFEILILALSSGNLLNFLVLNLRAWGMGHSQQICHIDFSLWAETFSSSSFLSQHSLLRPTLDILAWNSKFSADFNDRIMLI